MSNSECSDRANGVGTIVRDLSPNVRNVTDLYIALCLLAMVRVSSDLSCPGGTKSR